VGRQPLVDVRLHTDGKTVDMPLQASAAGQCQNMFLTGQMHFGAHPLLAAEQEHSVP
jgi:hypothetical protein